MDKNKANTKKQKEISNTLKTLQDNDSSRKNQYQTMFRELKKAKKRIAFLESESFKRKQDTEKQFILLHDEVTAIQSTLDFFTSETSDAEDTIQDVEVEEVEEEKEVKQKKEIMGIDFSDKVIKPSFQISELGKKVK